MRHFAKQLELNGWQVDYVALNDENNSGNLIEEISKAISRHCVDQVRICEPSDWKTFNTLKELQKNNLFNTSFTADKRFLASHSEFEEWAGGRKQFRMEYFYREMRRKTNILMEQDKPVGGKWNFDKDNRKPPVKGLSVPSSINFLPDRDTLEVISLIEQMYPDRIGDIGNFFYAVTREDALKSLNYFIDNLLPKFGDYQDALMTNQPFLFHSLLSPYINIGLLQPLEVCLAVEQAYYNDKAPLNAVEGYIRQIIGWREYVRGIYWLKMPSYLEENALQASQELPDFYWTGDTDMHCLSEAIKQTLEHSYAHHIQRLMITGNFALLIGVNPIELHKWYLAVYIDAFEWVELPNTLGMSQFSDGGLLGSKPYASSGAYINRMSNYCPSCKFNVKEKLGKDACPFNSLYWNFISKNKEYLRGNPRMSMPYRNLEKMDKKLASSLINQADNFVSMIEPAKTYR
jgi:deoxyribodipyrimidine photolyase-related protein